MKTQQLELHLTPQRNKKVSIARKNFHKLYLLLKSQIEERNKKAIKYTH